jgi:pyruvate formate lyase activating enzyme
MKRKRVSKLIIKGFIPTSLLDWDGKIVSTLYTPYCNFRCPYCQNAELVLNPKRLETIPFEVIEDYLTKNKKWIDGVCLTGGEPCMYKDLPEFIQKIRKLGVLVKLDTNGGFPIMLQDIIKKKLVDYIALDIKAPIDLSSYSKSTGVKNPKILEKVKKSIKLIMNSRIDYEFRTTVVPTLHKEKDIEKIAKFIKGAKKYALQNFSNKGEILDPQFKNVKPYHIEILRRMQKIASPYVKKCVVRGG